jgi:hexosaminidase
MRDGRPPWLLSVWLLLLSPVVVGGQGHVEPELCLVPRPVKVAVAEGYFELTPHTRILFTRSSREVSGVAAFLAGTLNSGTGFTLETAEARRSETAENAIRLTTVGADPSLGEEGYELLVTPDSVLVRAPSAHGLFYGVQTLRQLLPTESQTTWRVPCVSIEDKPRYGWRGMLLDCSRHFMSKEFVKRYVDLLAYHKMNVLHWHLTDDQGWRIEIKKYPKLTQVGAYRGRDHYGGFYSQADIREIVAYATSRFVTVVPEIELPGHCLAALASYPGLSCTGGPFSVAAQSGVFKDVFCAGSDGTFEFLTGVLDEVLKLFPSTYIHVGGDECPTDRWKACPKCQARMKAEDLKSENELRTYFVRRIAGYLASKGRKLIGWDDILDGGLPADAAIQWWRGADAGIEAAKKGHDVISSPTRFCYIDYSIDSISLQRIYSLVPTPDGIAAELGGHFLGAEATMWSAWVTEDGSDPDDRVKPVDTMVFPRLCGFAEAVWLPPAEKDWNDFVRRMSGHLRHLTSMGVRPGPGMPDIRRYAELPVRAGEWKPEQMSTESKTIDWDVSRFVDTPGTYEVEFRFEAGENGLTIESAALFSGDKEVSTDIHSGWAGTQKHDNAYRLIVTDRPREATYTLRVKLRSKGGTRSAGGIWIGRLR